jgi:hypothetical protein
MCRNSERWVFTLPQEFAWDSDLAVPEDLAFRDKGGVVRLILRRPNRILITPGYAWDGCSPKVCILDVLLGTPDGVVDSTTKQPKTYYASLVHDALYQFLLDGLPFHRWQADHCFLRLMAATGFTPRGVYWLAVRLFGWLFVAQHRYKRRNRGTRMSLAENEPPTRHS